MPLLVMCGFPCSGKSSRADQFEAYVRDLHNDREIHRVNDSFSGHSRDTIYSSTRVEKEVRSLLKAEVEKALDDHKLVLLDSLNYIKGFRYELYCSAKNSRTPHAVLFCDVNRDRVKEWNSSRSSDDQYSEEVLEALTNRLEVPDGRNRWDSPLFVVQPDDETLPWKELCESLFEGHAPKPNQSTQSLPAAPGNYLMELHKRTDDIARHVGRELERSIAGDVIPVTDSREAFQVRRRYSPAELQRCKRQFVSFTKGRGSEDLSLLATNFVQFLNNTLR